MLVYFIYCWLFSTTSSYITKILLVGSYEVDKYENVDVNAGKVGRYYQLAIKKDTIRKTGSRADKTVH